MNFDLKHLQIFRDCAQTGQSLEVGIGVGALPTYKYFTEKKCIGTFSAGTKTNLSIYLSIDIDTVGFG